MRQGSSSTGWVVLWLLCIGAWGCSNDRTYPKPDGPPIGYWEPLPAPYDVAGITESAVVLAGNDYLSWSGINLSCPSAGALLCPYGYALDLQTGLWREISATGAPTPRAVGGATWTGTEVIVWGGKDAADHWASDAAAYNPSIDTWRPISVEGAPSPREAFSTAWTGSEVLIWGGMDTTVEAYPLPVLGDGGLYDPATDSWRPMSNEGAPSPRVWFVSAWTGQEYVVWGGVSEVSTTNNSRSYRLGDGAAYDPQTDRWRPMATNGAPDANAGINSAWTGQEILMWGGLYGDAMAAYDPAANTWRSMDPAGPHPNNIPSCAVWTGRYFVVCGDPDEPQGALYDPELDHWQLMGMDGAPPSIRTGLRGYAYEGNAIVFGGSDHLSDFYDLAGYRFVIPEE